MKYILSAEGWQDNKRICLSINAIQVYLSQFYKFKVNKVYAKFGFIINDRRFDRFVSFLRKNKISIYRIVRIEFLIVYRWFEITYRKRHFGNLGYIYYKY